MLLRYVDSHSLHTLSNNARVSRGKMVESFLETRNFFQHRVDRSDSAQLVLHSQSQMDLRFDNVQDPLLQTKGGASEGI